MASLNWAHSDDVVVNKEYLARLERIAEILWEVESALPSGLEGFVEYEELTELRG